ncbi:glycosyltransferase family 1 protein [Curtobacterium sp. MCLR17_036]|uniref:glycosyltransferase family 4 protein n=1 Tax=Curtobacterium sp. MCLR17_036 TaxID=2175620 RepID=UPI0015E884F9|nr:glycosyltransferase family 1 protein [Curtobacterium sp. MCLR17_036]WIE65415.1 glycosyltransferase family 1 protein [Curtobacterium sp. MCLR17_036]
MHPLINAVALPLAHRWHGPFDATLAQNFAARVEGSGVFVHDVLFQSNPEWFTRTERIYLSAIPRSARRAAVVFTSSHSEQQRISTRNPRLRRVEATGLGLPSAILLSQGTADPDLEPGRFLLTVGRLNIRKNVGSVIESALRSARVSPAMPLVVVGSPDGRGEGLSARARAAVADGSIRFTGAVDDARLAWLYRECRLMLFLSLDEGYGLPPMEAAASGAPVVASERPVFREVLGGAASYVDPLDVDSIAEVVQAELDRPWRRDPRSAPGARSWTEVAASIRAGFARETA